MHEVMDSNLHDLYDSELQRLVGFGAEYGGGLSSHGPMALDSLASLGLPDSFGPYVSEVLKKLEPTDDVYGDLIDWQSQLRDQLPLLVHKAGSQAGHGLLRVAHAARALGRHESEIRRRELTAALSYWPQGVALRSPESLGGTLELSELLAELPRLTSAQRPEGLLVHALRMAMGEPGVLDLVAAGRPADDIFGAFDQLALAACAAQMRNTGLNNFALLHGVTVSMMAGELLPFLDEVGKRRLESAVVGFVVAAVVAYDDNSVSPETPTIEPGSELTLLSELAQTAAAGLDDHDIKFADACARLHGRTGSALPIQALRLSLGV
jgi:hypothetical protein